jgi:hypothetical protein
MYTNVFQMQRIEHTSLITTGAREAIKRSVKRLTLIPLIFFLLRIWGTMRFFLLILEVEMSPLTNGVLMTLQVSRIHTRTDAPNFCSPMLLRIPGVRIRGS